MIFVYLFLHALSLTTASEYEPQIEISPENQTVVHGGVAFFLCTATGTPTPKIEWKKNTRSLFSARYTKIDILGGSLLRIEPVHQGRDQTIFKCVAENGVGEPAIATAALTVLPNPPPGFPQFLPQRSFEVFEADHTGLLPCQVEGIPEPTVIWLKDMVPINMSFCRFSTVEGSLNITGVQRYDEGSYECVAENSVGLAVQSPIKLYVRARKVHPQFVIRPDPLHEVMYGGSLNLTCVAAGIPMPSVKWQIGSLEIVQEHDEPIGKYTLMLENITSSAKYTCMAKSELGVIESTAEIVVKDRGLPSKFTIFPDAEYEVKPGSDLNITCAAVGDPMPTVHWYFGCIDLTPISRKPIGENVLILENITLPGNYSCVARSELGSVRIRTSIVIPGFNMSTLNRTYPKGALLLECPCAYLNEKKPENENCVPVYQVGCGCFDRFVCPDPNTTVEDALTTPEQECVYEGKTYRPGEEIKTVDYCVNCSCCSIPEGSEVICEAVECPELLQLPSDKECYKVYENGKCCAADAICVPTEPEVTVHLKQERPKVVVEVSWSQSSVEYEHLEKYRLRYGRTNTSKTEEIIVNAGILKQTISGLDPGANYSFFLSAWNKLRWGPEAVTYLSTPQDGTSLELPSTVQPTDLIPLPECPRCEFRYLKHYEAKNCFPVFPENCSCPERYDCPNVQITPGNVCVYKEKSFEIGEIIPTGNPCRRCKCRYSSVRGVEISCSSVECPSHFRLSPPGDCYDVYERDKCCSVIKCPLRKSQKEIRILGKVLPEYFAMEGGNASLPCNITYPRENETIDFVFWFKDHSIFSVYTIDATKIPFERAPHYNAKRFGKRVFFDLKAESPALNIQLADLRDAGFYTCRVDFDRSPSRVNPMLLHVEPSCIYDGKIYHLGERIYPKTDPCLSCVCTMDWVERAFEDCDVQECVLERKLRYLRKGCIPIYHENKCCPIDFYCGTEDDAIPNNNSLTQVPGACVFEGNSYSIGEVLDIKDPTNCITCTCKIPPDFTCLRKACPGPPGDDYENCRAVYHDGECCPTYDCLKPPVSVACEPVNCLNGCQEVTGRNNCSVCLCDKVLCTTPKCPNGCEVEHDVPAGNCPRCRCSNILVQLAPVRCSPVQCDPECFEVTGSDGCLTCICGPLCSAPECGRGCSLQTEVPQGQCRGCVCPSDPKQGLVDGILHEQAIKCAPVTCPPACHETAGKFGCPTCVCNSCPPLNCSSGCELESAPLSGQCPKCVCI